MKHVIRPAAKDDILRQVRYYLLEDALDAATQFLDAVDQSKQYAPCRISEPLSFSKNAGYFEVGPQPVSDVDYVDYIVNDQGAIAAASGYFLIYTEAAASDVSVQREQLPSGFCSPLETRA